MRGQDQAVQYRCANSPVTLMATKQSEANFSVNSKLDGTFCRLIVRWIKDFPDISISFVFANFAQHYDIFMSYENPMSANFISYFQEMDIENYAASDCLLDLTMAMSL